MINYANSGVFLSENIMLNNPQVYGIVVKSNDSEVYEIIAVQVIVL